MASSSLSGIKRYHVFPSFHGPDVRKGFLSHLHYHFASKGITTFNDQEIKRGHTIGPELEQAIRESRVSLVVLSKNYASSGWCLDELVEIFRCKKNLGQIVMTVFWDVDPSDVRKQRGDFGNAFKKTCQEKSEKEIQEWLQSLKDVATIAGEHSLNWADEAKMIEKIATDISKKLNATPSRDFDGMVGMEAHLRKLISILCLDCDDVKMIGIWGPSGIGKSTIARAMYNRLSTKFQYKCFVGNLKGTHRSIMGVDDYDTKLALQSKLLSDILNQKDMKVYHLGATKECLHDQRVLIILDDVDDLEQLEVLAGETSWFGPGSRIIVTTKDKKILKAHGIKDIYRVQFPSEEEALEILFRSARKESSQRDSFKELAKKAIQFCGNLPLGLCVVGSSLRRESEDGWRIQLYGLETNLDRKIEDVLRVGYDKLLEKHKSLFLHIACFFNYENVKDVTTVLTDSNLDVEYGLNTLAGKSLVHISNDGSIMMHCLLQQLGKQVVAHQSAEPGKRQFLVDAEEICDVLANETGTGSVIGISFDRSKISEFSISKRAFEGMPNLRFLRIYGNGEVTVRAPKVMKYLPRLRLLHWNSYPRKNLPQKFQTECLVELNMEYSKLEKLWGGIQPLPSLKKLNLGYSNRLKTIPNLSKATNLEVLTLRLCQSFEEFPSSISNLQKLKKLAMTFCLNLRVVPTDINLASLEEVDMSGCIQLRSLPNISKNIKSIQVLGSGIEEFPESIIEHWPRLEILGMGSSYLKRFRHVPLSVTSLDLSNSNIKRIPNCDRVLPHLEYFNVRNCTKLLSIPALPPSLESLNADECVSLKRVCFSSHNPFKGLTFYNCLNLDEEARRGIIQQWDYRYICLPGKEVPADFTLKAAGNSIAIPLPRGEEGTFSVSPRFKACILVSSIADISKLEICCRLRSKGGVEFENLLKWKGVRYGPSRNLSEHVFVLCADLFHEQDRRMEVDVTMNEMMCEFSCSDDNVNIVECGVQILMNEAECSNSNEVRCYGGSNHYHSDEEDEKDEVDMLDRCFRISKIVNVITMLFWFFYIFNKFWVGSI